jgi:hypothetical protein|tara:strand:- start:247 stop:474 length:228 start_codon:yes stop_codon:yes gene_type:complete
MDRWSSLESDYLSGRESLGECGGDPTDGRSNVEDDWVISKHKVSYPNRGFEQVTLGEALLKVEVVGSARDLHFDA